MTVETNRRGLLATTGMGLLAWGTAAPAQQAPESARDRQLREDFPWLARYRAENDALHAARVRPSLVFMGDSITERWKRTHPDFFPAHRVNRGISGQTTPQMLLRTMQDVVALRPHAVHIMGGTNDVAGNTGPMTPEQTRDNVAAMATLAKANGIAVLIASVPPAAAFRWRPGVSPAATIVALNAMLREVAGRSGATWIDYHVALADANGGMRAGFAEDGVHPIDAGYAAMEAVLTPRLRRFERGLGG